MIIKDAQRGNKHFGVKSILPGSTLFSATVVRQPGEGNNNNNNNNDESK
jgi:hypothetical protein